MLVSLFLGLHGCAEGGVDSGLVPVEASLPFDCLSGPSDDPNLCAHGASCQDVLDAARSLGDGLYRLDPDGVGEGQPPFTAWCDMSTDGGGWTLLTGPLLRELDAVRFEHVAGRGQPRMAWTEQDGLWLSPEDADGCDTMALRATAKLPFRFETWWGAWSASGGTGAQHDDVYDRLEWGEVTEDCRGHIKFGTDTTDEKVGGEWGLHWMGDRVFSWGIHDIAPTDTLRWELVDQGSPEDLLITEIGIYVR